MKKDVEEEQDVEEVLVKQAMTRVDSNAMNVVNMVISHTNVQSEGKRRKRKSKKHFSSMKTINPHCYKVKLEIRYASSKQSRCIKGTDSSSINRNQQLVMRLNGSTLWYISSLIQLSTTATGISVASSTNNCRSRAVVLSITPTPASPYRHHQAVVPYYDYASTTYMATTDFIYNHLDTVAEFQFHEETVLRLNGGGVAYKPATCGVWRCS
nr:probable RNA-binding protein ARP1 isoform X2 [Tanacetum cinerariifolium]